MLTTFFIQIFTSPVIYVNNFDLTPISVLLNLIIININFIINNNIRPNNLLFKLEFIFSP